MQRLLLEVDLGLQGLCKPFLCFVRVLATDLHSEERQRLKMFSCSDKVISTFRFVLQLGVPLVNVPLSVVLPEV